MSEYLPEELEGLKQTHLTSGDEIYHPSPGKVPRKYIMKQKEKPEKTSGTSNDMNQRGNAKGIEHVQKSSKKSDVSS